jgi:hypothetical protein
LKRAGKFRQFIGNTVSIAGTLERHRVLRVPVNFRTKRDGKCDISANANDEPNNADIMAADGFSPIVCLASPP